MNTQINYVWLFRIRCRRRRQSQHQMEPAASADEPVPLKAACSDDVLSASSNGAVVGYDSSMQVLVNGHNGATNSTSASSVMPQSSF